MFKEDKVKADAKEPVSAHDVDNRRKYYKNLGIPQKGSKEHEKLKREGVSKLTSNIDFTLASRDVSLVLQYTSWLQFGCLFLKSRLRDKI